MSAGPYDPSSPDEPQAGEGQNWAQEPPAPPQGYGAPQGYPAQQAQPYGAQYGAPQPYATQQPYGVPPGYGYPQAAPSNGMGVGGFVTGLLGLIFCWVPWLGVLLSVVGVVLSGVGISQGKKKGAGIGLAVAGLVCGG